MNALPEWMNRSWTSDAHRWTPEGLALLRIFTALFIGCLLVPPSRGASPLWIASVPAEFFAPPPGPLALLTGFPEAWGIRAVRMATWLALLAMGAGWRTRGASLLAGAGILMLQGMEYTVGKINHEMVLPLVPLLFSASGWGRRWSVDAVFAGSDASAARRPTLPAAVPVLALLIGFMMFTAGVPKLIGGWLDPGSQAALGHMVNQQVSKGRDVLLSGRAAAIDLPIMWELADWGTVMFELGFLAAAFRPRWFRWFLAAAVGFHTSTMLTLNIAFLPNFVGYAVFLNWGGLAETLRRLSRTSRLGAGGVKLSRMAGVLPPLVVTAGAGLLVFPLTLEHPRVGDLTVAELAVVGSAAIGVAGFGVWRTGMRIGRWIGSRAQNGRSEGNPPRASAN